MQLDPRVGWWLMELPATACFLYHYLKPDPGAARRGEENERAGRGPSRKASLLLAALWVIHYSNRGWYFPLSLRVAPGAKANFGFGNAIIGAVFTALHGYCHALLLRTHGAHLNDAWLRGTRFRLGLVVYQIGFWLTVHSESVVRALRPAAAVLVGAARYRIPVGGGFRWLTNPQYFGELLAWLGWSVMTWSVPGAAVFTISALNLVPRAFQNHKWYLQKFPEYAGLGRKVLVPYLL